MTPKVKIFEIVFPDSSTGHLSMFRDQIWWKSVVAKLPKGRLDYHTQKTRAPRDSSQPPFCQKWANCAQNSLNVITHWHVNVYRIWSGSAAFCRTYSGKIDFSAQKVNTILAFSLAYKYTLPRSVQRARSNVSTYLSRGNGIWSLLFVCLFVCSGHISESAEQIWLKVCTETEVCSGQYVSRFGVAQVVPPGVPQESCQRSCHGSRKCGFLRSTVLLFGSYYFIGEIFQDWRPRSALNGPSRTRTIAIWPRSRGSPVCTVGGVCRRAQFVPWEP